MKQNKILTVLVGKKMTQIDVCSIVYILMKGNVAYIHLFNDEIVQTKTTLVKIEKMLGSALDAFIKIKRGCLVSVVAIHNVTDKVYLCNSEELAYATNARAKINAELEKKRRELILSFGNEVIPKTAEEYSEYYHAFDILPVAFVDMELIFDESSHRLDWVMRYGNPALAELEKLPLETLIGGRFSELFPELDERWLKTYEWTTLFGEMLQNVDYWKEIDATLKVICFPTFKGHCGCLLFNADNIIFSYNPSGTERAIGSLVGKLLNA